MKTFALCFLLALPAAGTDGSYPNSLATIGDAVLFFANDGVSERQLWRTDGTAAGTYMLTDFGKFDFTQPFLATERLYFFLGYDSSGGGEWGLWVSDGTRAGTLRLTGEDVAVHKVELFAAGQGLLYFRASDPEHGYELWRSDGTPAGTHMVADLVPGPDGAEIQELVECRGFVWFSLHRSTLWRTDGTAAGTARAIDPVPDWASRSELGQILALGDRLVFFAPSPRGRDLQLWAGDGTAQGTHPITGLPRNSYLLGPAVVQGGTLFFLMERVGGAEYARTLWASDGTRRGTRVLTRVPVSRLDLKSLVPSQGMGDRLFYLAERRGYGREPWVTDGTPGGTRMLQDVCPGPCTSDTTLLGVFGGRLWFTGSASDSFEERIGLWSSDGTPEGTSLVSELCRKDCAHDPPLAFFAVGERLVFVERASDGDMEVWSTDGTSPGTVQLTDFEPMFPWFEAGFQGAVLNGQLFFNADDGEHGFELWRTDGTRAGTELVVDLNPSIVGVSP